jgi:hypothetical protein
MYLPTWLLVSLAFAAANIAGAAVLFYALYPKMGAF